MPARIRQWLAEHRFEAFALLLALLPQLYVSLSNPNTILDWYSSDDGFYYFQVARNLAAGQGFTFDGLNPTNGFHPLWLFLITPIFWLAQWDVLLPLRLLMPLSALLSAGTAILLYRMLRSQGAAWAGALAGTLWLVLPSIHDLNLHSGTEAGLNAFCILLFWYGLIRTPAAANDRVNGRGLLALGGLAALAVMARLDNIFIVAAGGLWFWWRAWQPPAPGNPWVWRAQVAAGFAAPLAVTLSAYLAWNVLGFGTPTPVSGQVKLWWGTLYNTAYGFPVSDWVNFAGQFFTDHRELGPWSLFTAPLYAAAESLLAALGQAFSISARRLVLLGIGGLAVALGAGLAWAERRFTAPAFRNLGLLPLFLGCFLQIAYYKFGGSVAQQPWYWMAEMLWLLLFGGLALAALLRWLGGRLPAAGRRAAALGTLLLAGLALYYVGYLQSAIRLPGDGSNHYYLHRARWVETNTEPGARIAITGSGNLGYFTGGRTIVNMDGLMNTVEYFHALQEGRGADYLVELGVDYIFGNEYILTETNPYAPMLEGRLQPYKVYVINEERELPLWRLLP
ncbi:MAG: hypothetical protein KIS85_01185 [Anaerolineales bacterium]|nr:hypothetical protein [Anaerolineales bacterium]